MSDHDLKQTPRSGRIEAGNTSAGRRADACAYYSPKTEELQRALLELGFSFQLEYPKRKHPGLVVCYFGHTLRPRIRFKLMRAALRSEGIRPRRGLYDACFVLAWEGRNQP